MHLYFYVYDQYHEETVVIQSRGTMLYMPTHTHRTIPTQPYKSTDETIRLFDHTSSYSSETDYWFVWLPFIACLDVGGKFCCMTLKTNDT